MNDVVALTSDNPLRALRRADLTWSAREVQASGHVHAEWRNWEAAIKRAQLTLSATWGEDAAQHHFVSATTMIEIGKGGQRQVQDYDLSAVGLFFACQQSNLPELDLWFTFAGIQAAGLNVDGSDRLLVPASAPSGVSEVTAIRLRELEMEEKLALRELELRYQERATRHLALDGLYVNPVTGHHERTVVTPELKAELQANVERYREAYERERYRQARRSGDRSDESWAEFTRNAPWQLG